MLRLCHGYIFLSRIEVVCNTEWDAAGGDTYTVPTRTYRDIIWDGRGILTFVIMMEHAHALRYDQCKVLETAGLQERCLIFRTERFKTVLIVTKKGLFTSYISVQGVSKLYFPIVVIFIVKN